jgi:hypothetical protein
MKIFDDMDDNIVVMDEIIIVHLDEIGTDPTHTQQNLTITDESIAQMDDNIAVMDEIIIACMDEIVPNPFIFL